MSQCRIGILLVALFVIVTFGESKNTKYHWRTLYPAHQKRFPIHEQSGINGHKYIQSCHHALLERLKETCKKMQTDVKYIKRSGEHWIRQEKGIVQKCCHKPCSMAEITPYCTSFLRSMDKMDVTPPMTTTTTPAPTTTEKPYSRIFLYLFRFLQLGSKGFRNMEIDELEPKAEPRIDDDDTEEEISNKLIVPEDETPSNAVSVVESDTAIRDEPIKPHVRIFGQPSKEISFTPSTVTDPPLGLVENTFTHGTND